MSVTFRVIGDHDDDNIVNVSNANARDVLHALHVPGADDQDISGSMSASDLARLCLAFLNSTKLDPGLAPSEPLRDASRARYVECGRREGYLHEVAGRLWKLALRAGPGGEITWE